VGLANRFSLGQRLLIGLLLVSFAYWGIIAWLTVRDSINELNEVFDAHLAQTALALLRVTDPDETDPPMTGVRAEGAALSQILRPGGAPTEGLTDRAISLAKPDKQVANAKIVPDESIEQKTTGTLQQDYEKRMRYQIWNSASVLLLRSANAPAKMLTATDGYSDSIDDAGRSWRHYGVWDSHHQFRVLVTEATEARHRLERNIVMHLTSPLALGLPVLILLLWVSINKGLNPLALLTRQIEARKPDNLLPLDADSAPAEVRPMVVALNKLLERIGNTLQSERCFTANAAHELRTPLAAIQAQLHAARAAESDEERRRSMDQLQRGVERGIRLVGQLLVLARLDPEQALPDVKPVNLGEVAQAVCAELAPLALQREQILELDVEAGVPLVQGNADMLSMLLANLVDNAIRYTPQGGNIGVAVRRNATGLVMEVSDDGHGIPAAQRERVLERFYRIANQDQPGTGLGLAICRRIADIHDVRIELADGHGGSGLRASVLFAA
jgi:two-component system sensor histidine kinase QseC